MTTICGTARTLGLVLLIGIFAIAGCTRSPEAKKARHLDRGDKYFARAQYQEAAIEYANVLRIDAKNTRAIQQLALAHFELGQLGLAFPHLVRLKELEPDNLENRLRLGTLYLAVARPQEARNEAEFILKKDPKNLDALLLAAGAARTPEEVRAEIHRLEEVRAAFERDARFHLGLGALYVKHQDLARAERAFEDAIAREPKSVQAHVALGDLYILRRDAAQGEREYKAAADLAPVASQARLKLADFYVSFQKPDEAKRILTEITQKAPDAVPAWRRLAEIALEEQKYEEGVKFLDTVFKKSPSDLRGHILRGRLHVVKGETTQAIEEFQKVLKVEPGLVEARYRLARAYLQAGNLQQAKTELKEATAVDPDFVPAAVLLAELNIQTGAAKPAIETLERLIAKRPGAVDTYIILGTAHLANRQPALAAGAFRKISELAPRDPRGPYLLGVAWRAQGKRAEARKEFEASLALDPSFIDPLNQLASMAIADKASHVAAERINAQIARVPQSAGFYRLLGAVYVDRGETQSAEAAFLKAVELDPNLIGGYVALASLYASAGKNDQGLANADRALKVNSKNVTAHIIIGIVSERKGDIARAQRAYEQALAVNPRLAPAANNLAYLYAWHGGDKEKALQLAQLAKEVAPQDPYISDTLGWILYSRGVYQRALSLLKESATKLPDNAEVQYHLGMVQHKLGNREAAKEALARALKLGRSFAGADEARVTLAKL